MTIINTYGISAGREIPREINDESDKHRREAKRRADAAYLSDKERLHARFRQMNEHAAQVSADRFTALMQEQPADIESRVSAQRSPMPSHEDADQALQAPSSPPTAEDNPGSIPQLSGRGLPAARESSRRPLEPVANSLSALGAGALAEQKEIGVLDPVANSLSALGAGALAEQKEIGINALTELRGSDDREGTAGAPDLLDRLSAEFNRSPMSLTRERVTAALERISQDIQERSSREVTLKEKAGVLGYFEFLEGYFEKGETSAGPSPQLAALMESIRVQLSTVSDPLRVTEIQSMAVASQLDNQLPVQAISRDQRKKQLKPDVVLSEKAQRSDLDVYAAAAMMNVVGTDKSAAPKKESSLSKDAQRRSEETLVAVTLRSV